ncbi:arylsulfatase [Aquabacterium humicola]|uniref:arylsulfatase n=1 Tax=Aquabacterium humicola TaxID=3237377 RepID=UPI0025428A65|nr:arylsulfatase [Rubrivivax pictus]
MHHRAGRRLSALLAAIALAACSATPPPVGEAAARPAARPNILLILADDLGYADLGAYGGEIATPHLDRLARHGATLTSFYASPFCSPTRAMLMSGTDNHLAGFGDMAELMLPEQRGKPGYEGYLSTRVAAIPEVLRAHGYRTVMAGKWHLGNAEEQSPAARGFDRSYAMTMGGASHFGDQSGIVATDPDKPPKALYRENGKPVDTPRQHFYSSEAFADRLVQYLDETRGDGRQPFFAYLAFTAPHWPLHAKDEDIARYEHRYVKGYDALRAERFERQKSLGVIPADSRLYAGHSQWPGWSRLTPEQQRSEARRMAVYAAMVDNMDRQIGRVLAHLERTGELDNTVVVFLSDNGADGNSVYDVARTREWVHKAMDNSTANVGRPGSFVEYGPGWAQVGMTPFNLYKSFMYEGGISVPAIVWAPAQGVVAQRRTQVGHVMDIAPTLYELAGASHPATKDPAAGVLPVKGRSLLAYLQGKVSSAYAPGEAIGWELGGRKALRKGDWKIVYANAPWGKGAWELYNLAEDRTEQNDLAATQPAKLAELLADWRRYVAENGVLEIPGLATRPGYSNGAKYYDDLALEAAQQPRAK